MAERCTETGHCALHGEEVERRKETKAELDSLDDKYDKKIGDIWSKIAACSNFQSQAKVAGIIATLVFGSSFLYTFNHIQVSNRTHREAEVASALEFKELRREFTFEDDKLHRLVNQNESDIDSLETGALLTNQRLSGIEASTSRIEQRLSQLVNILADSGEINPKDRYRWDYVPETGYGGDYDE